MSDAEISLVLQMISEWIEALEQCRLNQQCRESGDNFFAYMTSRGISQRILARKIIDATGINPAALWTVNDAAMLRDAIFRYEASIESAKKGEDPKWSVDHFRGK